MKTKIFLFILFFAVFFAFFYRIDVKNVAYADESDIEEELSESVDATLDKLDTSKLEEYFDSLSEDEKGLISDDVKTMLKKLVSGDVGLSFTDFLAALFKGIAGGLTDFIPAVLTVMVVSVLSGMLKGLNSGFLNDSTSEIVGFACYAAVLTVVISETAKMFTLTVETVGRVEKLTNALFPVLITLMTALGGTSGAGFIKPLAAVASAGAVKIVKSVVLPCFTGSVVIGAVGNVSPSVKLSKLSDFFRKIGEWVLKLSFSAFVFYLTVAGILGRTVDGVGVNAARFALKSYVPVVGGYLSDGFDVVMASCVLIKNALGVTGLIILASVVLFPVLKMAAFIVLLRFAAAAVEPLGADNTSEILTKIAKSCKLLVSSVLAAAFAFFALVLTVSLSCNTGVTG